MMKMHKTFQDLKNLMHSYRKKIREEGKAALTSSFQEVFNAYPEIQTICWTQYTDAISFGVNPFMISILPILTSEQMFSNEEIDEKKYCSLDLFHLYSADTKLAALGKAVHKLQLEIPSDVFETIFGDHVCVTATREGFVIVDYEPD